MDQFSDVTALIATIDNYLLEGRMKCDQFPADDIIAFISEEYNTVAIDDKNAIENYRKLLESCILRNDVAGISSVLRLILNENRIISELYDEKIKKTDLGGETVPYRIELQYYKNLEKNHLCEEPETKSGTNICFTGKGAVFSAITGSYDGIRLPEYINEDLDYFLFTDVDNIETDIWKVIKIENKDGLDSTRLARRIKIIGGYEYLSEYDYTIWTDGKLQITGDVKEYIQKYSVGSQILCFNHYASEDIYEEAVNCIMLNRDDPDIIRSQINRYRNEGYPEHSGLIDSCMLVRDNRSEELKSAMYDWWEEVRKGSKRDQLSFNYICWKNNIRYDSSPLISYMNPYVRTYNHGN